MIGALFVLVLCQHFDFSRFMIGHLQLQTGRDIRNLSEKNAGQPAKTRPFGDASKLDVRLSAGLLMPMKRPERPHVQHAAGQIG